MSIEARAPKTVFEHLAIGSQVALTAPLPDGYSKHFDGTPTDLCPDPNFYCAKSSDGTYVAVAVEAGGKEVPFPKDSVPDNLKRYFKDDGNGNLVVSKWVEAYVSDKDWSSFYNLVEGQAETAPAPIVVDTTSTPQSTIATEVVNAVAIQTTAQSQPDNNNPTTTVPQDKGMDNTIKTVGAVFMLTLVSGFLINMARGRKPNKEPQATDTTNETTEDTEPPAIEGDLLKLSNRIHKRQVEEVQNDYLARHGDQDNAQKAREITSKQPKNQDFHDPANDNLPADLSMFRIPELEIKLKNMPTIKAFALESGDLKYYRDMVAKENEMREGIETVQKFADEEIDAKDKEEKAKREQERWAGARRAHQKMLEILGHEPIYKNPGSR